MTKDVEEISADLEACKTEMGQQLEQLRLEVFELKNELSPIMENLKEIISLWKSGTGFIRTVKWLGHIVLWGGAVSGAIAAFLHFGKH